MNADVTAWISAASLALAAVLFLVAAANYGMALERVRETLPRPLNDPFTARFALDSAVWNRVVPNVTRQQYLMFLFCASGFGTSMSAFLLSQSSYVGSLLFFLISLVGFGHAFICRRKYRALNDRK